MCLRPRALLVLTRHVPVHRRREERNHPRCTAHSAVWHVTHAANGVDSVGGVDVECGGDCTCHERVRALHKLHQALVECRKRVPYMAYVCGCVQVCWVEFRF